MFSILRNQRGSSVAMVALSIVCLFVFAALAVDLGQYFVSRTQLQNMVDAAALAGAQELRASDKTATQAKSYANNNGKSGDEVKITVVDKNGPKAPISFQIAMTSKSPSLTELLAWVRQVDWFAKMSGLWTNTALACYPQTPNRVPGTSVTVTGTRMVEFTFAKVFGINNTQLTVSSTAQLAALSTYEGNMRPWGMWKSALISPISNLDKVGSNYFGKTYTLKVGKGKLYNTNFVAIDLPKGTNNYIQNIQTGYTSPVSTGYVTDTDVSAVDATSDAPYLAVKALWTADKNVTDNNVQRGSSRIIIVPIIEPVSTPLTIGTTLPSSVTNDLSNGTNLAVKVVGFAALFIESFNNSSFVNQANGTVTVRLMEVVLPDAIDNLSLYGYGNYGLTKAVLTSK